MKIEVAHVEAGTEGRLLRVCMRMAGRDHRWRAVGRAERLWRDGVGTILRQRLERPVTERAPSKEGRDG